MSEFYVYLGHSYGWRLSEKPNVKEIQIFSTKDETVIFERAQKRSSFSDTLY